MSKKSEPSNKETSIPKLGHIVVIGKFDDGKCRQILIGENTEEIVLSAIIASEGKINVYDKPIETIDIELQ